MLVCPSHFCNVAITMTKLPFLSVEAPFTLALMVLCFLIVARPLYARRRSQLNTIVFYVCCLLGDLAAGLIDDVAVAGPARWLREVSVFGQGLAVIRFLGLVFFDVVVPRFRIAISRILADILVIAAYVLWAFVRLNLAGVEFTHIFATSAVLTAVLAISMQDTLGNLLGGLALQMDNSLEIGDWIVLDTLSGKVIDIQWRYTALLTRSGEKVVVPNSHLMKNRYMVLCDCEASPGWRRWVWFNVDLAVRPAWVIQVVTDDIKSARIPNVMDRPAPTCVLMEFCDGYARYGLRYWLDDPALDDPTDSEVRRHVLAALQRQGIRLAVTDHTVHLVKEGQSHRKEVRSRELTRRLDALAGLEIFQCLEDEERVDLAQRLVYAPFARGDILTRQGAVAHWLYIIVAGEAEAWWQPPEGPQRLLEKRGPGSVFGEPGLMTGAPRRATVIAITDVEAYRLDKESFGHIVRARPELAEIMSTVLERRLARVRELEAGYESDRQGHAFERGPSEHAALSQRIRDFFRI